MSRKTKLGPKLLLNSGLNSDFSPTKLLLNFAKLDKKKLNNKRQLQKQTTKLLLNFAKPVKSLVLPPPKGLNTKLFPKPVRGRPEKIPGLRSSPLYGRQTIKHLLPSCCPSLGKPQLARLKRRPTDTVSVKRGN